MKIAQKEASETMYWLSLLRDTNLIEEGSSKELINECHEIRKIISSIVLTMVKKEKIRNLSFVIRNYREFVGGAIV